MFKEGKPDSSHHERALPSLGKEELLRDIEEDYALNVIKQKGYARDVLQDPEVKRKIKTRILESCWRPAACTGLILGSGLVGEILMNPEPIIERLDYELNRSPQSKNYYDNKMDLRDLLKDCKEANLPAPERIYYFACFILEELQMLMLLARLIDEIPVEYREEIFVRMVQGGLRFLGDAVTFSNLYYEPGLGKKAIQAIDRSKDKNEYERLKKHLELRNVVLEKSAQAAAGYIMDHLQETASKKYGVISNSRHKEYLQLARHNQDRWVMAKIGNEEMAVISTGELQIGNLSPLPVMTGGKRARYHLVKQLMATFTLEQLRAINENIFYQVSLEIESAVKPAGKGDELIAAEVPFGSETDLIAAEAPENVQELPQPNP